ncbi:DUF6718 family protein [Clostridium sp. B9]|uniref:DUF6718 family protein n=1 Tax=Clostridium sp. B9 TaxID=3423224 RepID=UPI003D2EB3ED
MKYIVARKLNTIGCYAFKVKDIDIVELFEYLTTETLEKNIEIFITNALESYGEYKPYKFIENKEEFINSIKFIVDKIIIK